ncbi:MAG: ZIP family metal transporter [Miltoncostaeaceae bacterium]
MGEAALWGFIGASSLLVGAAVAFRFTLSRSAVGLIMAFGIGTLIAAISFELVVPALQDVAVGEVALGLLAGAGVFFVGDLLIDRLGGGDRKGGEPDEEGSGTGIVLGTVLDGIPESAVLGMAIATGEGVSVALVGAIWLSNFPESLGSTVGLLKSGMSKTRVFLMWLAIVAISAISAALGYLIVTESSTLTGALVSAFAAGALLTMVADEMAPQAYRKAGKTTGILVTLGFILAVALTSLDI